MPRHIKFRGKSLVTGEWVYGSLLTDNDAAAFIVEDFGEEARLGTGISLNNLTWHRVDEKTVGQLSNEKTHLGEEVYEGDILQRVVNVRLYGTDLNENVDDYGLVKFHEEYGGFYIGERPLFAEIEAKSDFYTGCRCTKFEKVGNIHDNPKLLTEQEVTV